MLKKAIVAVFVTAFLLSASYAQSGPLVASRKSNIYHLANCPHARKILPANKMQFNSPKEAQQYGMRPCKVCKPPAQ